MTVSKEAVIYAYRFFLGRDPESDQAIENHMTARDEQSLVRTIALSKEFSRTSIPKDLLGEKSNDAHKLFRTELNACFKDYCYSWDKFKEQSCDWITNHVPDGLGVDLGGTTYLVKAINSMNNRECIFYDFFSTQG